MDEMKTMPWITDAVERIESDERLDAIADKAREVAESATSGRAGAVLRGDWLGHALHPLLTDLPLGCWLSASMLDILGGRTSSKAAQRLVGLGVLASLPTAASGAAELPGISDRRVLRVAMTHAAGNTGVLAMYMMSWRSRRKGRHLRGIMWALTGGGLAMASGHLGGHLSFARRVGTGERGQHHAPPDARSIVDDPFARAPQDEFAQMSSP